MTSVKHLEIQFKDPSPQKWSHPLKEDVFAALMNKENSMTVYKSGSVFSPLLFGNFFDPSDAFPLWEFESEALLPNASGSSSSSSPRSVDWYQTDADFVLKTEIPAGTGLNNLQVCIENGKILEISGQYWKQQRESRRTKDWRSSHWWEYGCVRRIELPEQTDWKKADAHVNNDAFLEIRIPKTPPDSDTAQGN